MAFLQVQNSDLLTGKNFSFLTASSSVGDGTVTVKDYQQFSINQYVLIGNFGDEGSEIIKIHASTAPTSAGVVTLATALLYQHSYNDRITQIDFNQVAFYHATSSVTTSIDTTLSTQSVNAGSTTSTYDDTVNVTGYAFIRFYNSTTLGYSSYSAAIPYAYYTQFSARTIIDDALDEVNQTIGSTADSVLTNDFAFKQINNCQIETLRELKRWSFMQKFGQNIGTTASGNWKVAVPTDLDDQNTNKSIWNLRMSREPDLTWVDKEKWDQITYNVVNTTLAANIVVGASTITLTDSGDFGSSGTVTVGANSYDFTANDTTTNILTLSSVSTTTNTAGEDCFQFASIGRPMYWTIYGGFIYFYPVVSSTFTGRNIYLDYYSSMTLIVKDSDTIVLPDPTIVQYYLQWKFLRKVNNGQEDTSSIAAMKLYIDRREKLKEKDTMGRSFALKPRLNQMYPKTPYYADDKRTRLGNYPDA